MKVRTIFISTGLLLGLLCLVSLVGLPAEGQSTPNPKLPTLFVVGDSTANNNANGAQGWGDPFIAHFDATKINVLNRARAGRSSRTFVTEGLWDKVLADMKAGDFVLIQFGHNDGGAINDPLRARGSLPGLGEETQEIDNLQTKQHEVVHTYGWYMRKMIADAKQKGATPIVLSLTVRNIWKDGKVERGSGHFGEWAQEIAKSQHVAFIELDRARLELADAELGALQIDQDADRAREFGLQFAHDRMNVAQALMRGVTHVHAEHVGARFEQASHRCFVVGGRTERGDDLDPAISPHWGFGSPSGSVRRTVQSRSSPVSTSKKPVLL